MKIFQASQVNTNNIVNIQQNPTKVISLSSEFSESKANKNLNTTGL